MRVTMRVLKPQLAVASLASAIRTVELSITSFAEHWEAWELVELTRLAALACVNALGAQVLAAAVPFEVFAFANVFAAVTIAEEAEVLAT